MKPELSTMFDANGSGEVRTMKRATSSVGAIALVGQTTSSVLFFLFVSRVGAVG